jgi:hypothetical protein
MTHGPATCTGMVDEALKRPPSQKWQEHADQAVARRPGFPSKWTYASASPLPSLTMKQVSVSSTDQGGGKRRGGTPRAVCNRRRMPRTGVESGLL